MAGKKLFTNEEIEILRSNPFVYKVTKNVVKFTPEFKKYYYEHHSSGERVVDIFTDCGIDVEILGEKRLSSFCHNINLKVRSNATFETNSKKKSPPKEKIIENASLNQRVKTLETELEYTKQEVEFLKKIQNAILESK